VVASANRARRGPLVEGAEEELEFVRLDLVVMICSRFWDGCCPRELLIMSSGDTGSKPMGDSDVGVIAKNEMIKLGVRGMLLTCGTGPCNRPRAEQSEFQDLGLSL